MIWAQLLSNKRLGQESLHLDHKDDRTEFKPSQINVLCELLHIVDPDERKQIFLI